VALNELEETLVATDIQRKLGDTNFDGGFDVTFLKVHEEGKNGRQAEKGELDPEWGHKGLKKEREMGCENPVFVGKSL